MYVVAPGRAISLAHAPGSKLKATPEAPRVDLLLVSALHVKVASRDPEVDEVDLLRVCVANQYVVRFHIVMQVVELVQDP